MNYMYCYTVINVQYIRGVFSCVFKLQQVDTYNAKQSCQNVAFYLKS